MGSFNQNYYPRSKSVSVKGMDLIIIDRVSWWMCLIPCKTSFFTPDLFPPSVLSLFSWISVGIKLAFSLWELSLFPPVSKWHQPSISDVADWISHPSHSTLWRNTRGIHGVLTEGQEKFCRVSVGQNPGWAEGTVVLSCFQAKYRENLYIFASLSSSLCLVGADSF